MFQNHGSSPQRVRRVLRREPTFQNHGEDLRDLGGPGSGWHAKDGHVPGSQGGSGRDPDYKQKDSVGRSIGRTKSTAERTKELKRSIASHKETRADYVKQYGARSRQVRDQDKIIKAYETELKTGEEVHFSFND